MKKSIKIGDTFVDFKASASTPRRYREKFGKDLLLDINNLLPHAQKGELDAYDLETFENLAYIMAKQADSSVPDDPSEWLDGFEVMDIYEALPKLFELWGNNVQTLETPKKKQGRQKGN